MGPRDGDPSSSLPLCESSDSGRHGGDGDGDGGGWTTGRTAAALGKSVGSVLAVRPRSPKVVGCQDDG